MDFLARCPSGAMDLIQVCSDAGDPNTSRRELRALVEAEKLFPKARKFLLTLTMDGMPRETPLDVSDQSAYAWMLMGLQNG